LKQVGQISIGWSHGASGQLGHGDGADDERVPRAVEALAGKRVVGAAAGECYTFGGEPRLERRADGAYSKLGHGGNQEERVPRVVEALAGHKVVGAAAGARHAAVWTASGGVYTFGLGEGGRLGHGGQGDERVPRVGQALAGQRVVGAAAGASHTAMWTDEGRLYQVGLGFRIRGAGAGGGGARGPIRAAP
jgi:alpha-tubulin suppressor-like RCC1 family protein